MTQLYAPCDARTRAQFLLPVIEAIRAEGRTSLNQIAHRLNELNIPTREGGRWQASQVKRLLVRVSA